MIRSSRRPSSRSSAAPVVVVRSSASRSGVGSMRAATPSPATTTASSVSSCRRCPSRDSRSASCPAGSAAAGPTARSPLLPSARPRASPRRRSVSTSCQSASACAASLPPTARCRSLDAAACCRLQRRHHAGAVLDLAARHAASDCSPSSSRGSGSTSNPRPQRRGVPVRPGRARPRRPRAGRVSGRLKSLNIPRRAGRRRSTRSATCRRWG